MDKLISAAKTFAQNFKNEKLAFGSFLAGAVWKEEENNEGNNPFSKPAPVRVTYFTLSDKEEQEAEEFKKFCKGSRFSYIFTPTELGMGVTIKCMETGEERDITDYDRW